MASRIDHKETGHPAQDQSHEGGLAGKVVECFCGCVVGALVGLVAGWFGPGLCLVMYFQHLRQPGDQAGLILLLTAPLGAIIGGIAGLRLRRWWYWGLGALLGLGPATVLLFVAPAVFLAFLFVSPFGYLLLKCAWDRLEGRRRSGSAKRAAPPPAHESEPEPNLQPGDVFGEYQKWKQQQKQQHVRRPEEEREGQ